jgi:hypothetical protein
MIMPVGIARQHRPRNGIQPPLAERWQAAIDELGRVAPGVPFGSPVSEISLDDLHDLIARERKAKAPPEPTPELVEAMADFGDQTRMFNSLALELKAAQKWLDRARGDWKHQLLKDISPDCYTIPPLLPTGDAMPDFTSVWSARQATKDLLPKMQWARGALARIFEAQAFDEWEPGHQAIALVKALARENTALKKLGEDLWAALSATEARLDRLERNSKRSTPKQKGQKP